MSPIQELQPLFDEYPYKMKKARMDKGLTQKQLSDMSGVPYSAITKMATNNQDALLNCVALCMVLDVSMDELFGLKTAGSNTELQEQNHAMAIENAHQAGELKRLETANDAMADHLLTRKTVIYVLLGLCGFLAVSLAFYIFIDSRMLNSGIVINGKFTVLAWILVLLIIATFLTVIVVMIAIVRMSKNKNNPQP